MGKRLSGYEYDRIEWLGGFVLELFLSVGELFLKTFFSVPLNILFWIILLVIYFQYRRLAATEKRLFGRSRTEVFRQVFNSVIYGAVAGFVASTLLLFLGVSLTDLGILYILPLAFLLLLFKMRFLCFAYAGGLVALLSSLLNLFPVVGSLLENTFLEGLLYIHVPGLLSLIAVLHLIESVLIRFSGHLNPSPVYLKTPEGQIVGGFSLQVFWPLPLVGLILAAALQLPATGETLAMPDWWPLLGIADFRLAEEGLVFIMLPLVAWLGYGDIAVSSSPREKTRFSSRILAIYSLTLMGLALLATHFSWLIFPAALFSPLGHELLIRQGNRREFNGKYLFAPAEKGVKVLAVFPGTPAATFLESGDIILSITEKEVNDIPSLWAAIYDYYPFVHFEVLKTDGRIVKKNPSLPSLNQNSLGAILVPENPSSYAELKY